MKAKGLTSDELLQDLLDNGAITQAEGRGRQELREDLLSCVEDRMALDCEILRVQTEQTELLRAIRLEQAEFLQKLSEALGKVGVAA